MGEAHPSLHPQLTIRDPIIGNEAMLEHTAPAKSAQSRTTVQTTCRLSLSLEDTCAFKPVSFRLFLLSCSVTSNSFVRLWTVSCWVPLSTGFPRQEDWIQLPIPSPGDLPRDRTCISCIVGGFFLLLSGFQSSKNWNFPGGAVVKNPLVNARDAGLIPGHVSPFPRSV